MTEYSLTDCLKVAVASYQGWLIAFGIAIILLYPPIIIAYFIGAVVVVLSHKVGKCL